MKTAILRPVLIYGCEAWALTKPLKSRIQAAEMKVLRMIKGVTKRDRLKNQAIREDVGVMSVLDLIEESKMRWYGHVMRMEDERYPKRMLEWIPDARRPVGRPRARWMKGIEEALESRNTSLGEIQDGATYEDRAVWRNLTRICR